MSISSISAGSLAGDLQQSRRGAELGAGPQTTVAKAASAPLGAAAPPSGSTQPQGEVRHPHGGDRGPPPPPTDGSQSGSASGSKSVNTLA
jgi:hypothetical protein